MQEILFSYNKKENKRKKELRFKYNNYNNISYIMRYRRNNIDIDLNYFEDLVFLYKKITRSSYTDNIFSDLRKNLSDNKNDFISIKLNKRLYIYPSMNFIYKKQNMKRFIDDAFTKLTFDHYVVLFDNISAKNENNEHEIYITSNIFLNKPINKLLYNEENIFINHYYILNNYDSLYALKNNNSYYIMQYNFVFLKNMSFSNGLYIFNIDLFHKINHITDYFNKNIIIHKDSKYANDYFIDNNVTKNNKYTNINKIYAFKTVTNFIINILSNNKYAYRNKLFNMFNNVLNIQSNNNKYMTYFKNNFANLGNKYINNGKVNNDFLNKDNMLYYKNERTFVTNNNKNTIYFNNINAYKYLKTATYYKNEQAIKNASGYLNVYDNDFAQKMPKITFDLHQNNYLNKNNAYIRYFYAENFANKLFSNIYINNSNNLLEKSYKNTFESNIFNFANNNNKILSYFNEILFANKKYNVLYDLNNINNAEKSNFSVLYLRNNDFLFKNYANLHLNTNNIDSMKLYYKKIQYNNTDFLNKDGFISNIISNNDNLYKDYHIINKIDQYYQNTIANKYTHKLYYDNISLLNKYNFKGFYYNINSFNKYIKYVYDNKYKTLNKYIHKSFYNELINIYKEKNEINRRLDGEFINKSKYSIIADKSTNGIYKEANSIQIKQIDTDYITKALYSFVIFNDDYSNFIISLNRINYSVFNQDIVDKIYKSKKYTKIYNKQESIIKTSYNIFYNDNLLCDKISYNTELIDIFNYSVIKKHISVLYYNNNVFIIKNNNRKIFHNLLIEFQKTKHDIIFNENVFFKNTYRKIFKNELLQTNIYQKDIFINNSINFFQRNNADVTLYFEEQLLKQMKYVFFTGQTFINDSFKNVTFDKDDIFINKYHNDLHRTDIKDIENFEVIKNFSLQEVISTMHKQSFSVDFFDNLFLNKDILLKKYPEIEFLARTVYEANLMYNPVDNWVWVYSEEEPFDGDLFKIDELLLPENDTRYEKLEEILFDRETLKPRYPIKEIDEYSFIARFPTRYPIKDENGLNAYENVALEYLDVHTNIMRKVFLAYYAIWQENVFDFAKMTMEQSAKKMLDYLYAWITLYIAVEDQPEALRTFKLIRWYLERGILECSDYIITYEPDDLTSGKLKSDDDLKIPNDIVNVPDILLELNDGKANTTMYIDYKLSVIRNDGNKLNEDAYITFLIENKKNTDISFNICSLSGVPVKIILNDKVIDELTLSGTAKLIYNIPYNDKLGYNIFKILKEGQYNNDEEFYIGNIKIHGMGKTGDLKVDFDPKIQGNKVLNYVNQKVLTYINLYEDNKTLIDELIKGNVHISEVYEHLLEYWELHHQNKDKGKRLTIKET